MQEAPRNTCRQANFTAREKKTFKSAHLIQEKKLKLKS